MLAFHHLEHKPNLRRCQLLCWTLTTEPFWCMAFQPLTTLLPQLEWNMTKLRMYFSKILADFKAKLAIIKALVFRNSEYILVKYIMFKRSYLDLSCFTKKMECICRWKCTENKKTEQVKLVFKKDTTLQLFWKVIEFQAVLHELKYRLKIAFNMNNNRRVMMFFSVQP